MAARSDRTARTQRSLPFVALCGALTLALPSAGLALAGAKVPARAAASLDAVGLGMFTPASVDPALAARVADKARARGLRFTPASAPPVSGNRTVTVAVRVDDDSARAISVRKSIEALPGRGIAPIGIEASRFQLGSAIGYQSFTRTVDLSAKVNSNVAMPDLAQFKLSQPRDNDKPSRLQPRIELEDREIAGRSPNTLDSIGAQTVGVGGSFRLSPNLDVMAGVRYSQERERLDPLTNSVKDSQAVYVGTQIKF
ncbi:hypothetical protein CHX26_03155 [Porphyrobacter sp. HT-58-2]|uniref:hypothetical protein n=1 Tax=Porphyrobacter sp. HT-58-2 TaxID=2023229 RepID=UPI000CDC0161|nr:hypothetical protein [Porphyrobacter sp. HT-58-2]AUX68640.1 hypothetical protein CHX26_03155 [Porphyrobacter sp. HT-58-2]